MKDLSDARWIKAKGILFLLLAGISTAMLLADHPNIRFILLFSIAVWSFCRFYYFAFYVITNYVDPTYKFSGLGSFAKYLLTKTRRRSATLITLAFSIAAVNCNACPACNIHNYLAESIVQSSNVVIGRLIASGENRQAQIEVIRPLRGSYRAGQSVTMNAWSEKDDVGQIFIFSDPWDHPSFPMLETNFQSEVLFLLKLADLQHQSDRKKHRLEQEFRFESLEPGIIDQYRIADVDEAIDRVQGISNESREVGLKYLATCKPFPTAKITGVIEQLRKRTDPTNYFTADCTGGLLEAIMIGASNESESYIVEKLHAALIQPRPAIDWLNLPDVETPNAVWIGQLLGTPGTNWTFRKYAERNKYRKHHPTLVAKEKLTLLNALQNAHGLLTSEIVFALIDTRTATVDEVLASANVAKTHDEVCLGILWSCYPLALFSDKDETLLTALNRAATLATKPQLKSRITERLSRYSKFSQRKQRVSQ